jgi:hypothetical protein
MKKKGKELSWLKVKTFHDKDSPMSYVQFKKEYWKNKETRSESGVKLYFTCKVSRKYSSQLYILDPAR